MKKFSEWLEEKKKCKCKKEPSQPTSVSAPLRGPNQDYSGVGVKHSTADYTISDETITELVSGVGPVRNTPVTIKTTSHTGGSNAPKQAANLQKAATSRARELDKSAQRQKDHAVKTKEDEIKKRQQAHKERQGVNYGHKSR